MQGKSQLFVYKKGLFVDKKWLFIDKISTKNKTRQRAARAQTRNP